MALNGGLNSSEDVNFEGESSIFMEHGNVLVVSEYREKDEFEKPVNKRKRDIVSPPPNTAVRRNPIRKVRINIKRFSKEHILEEDFALLDACDDERNSQNKICNRKPSPPTEILKQLPVNVQERSKYNMETKKEEPLDYSLKEETKKQPKKPKLETILARRKPKKKFSTRKRKPRDVAAEKTHISELKMLVDSTTELLNIFFRNCKETTYLRQPNYTHNLKCGIKNRLQAFQNQIILYAVVNGMEQDAILNKIEQGTFLGTETGAKE